MEITQFIQKIQSLESDLETVSLSAIEKDILLKKIAALYENLLLKKTAFLPEKTTIEIPKIETPIVAEKAAEKIEISSTIIETKKEEPVGAKNLLPDTSSIIEEKPETKHATNLLELNAEKPLLNERFHQNSVGLNERIQQNDLKKLIDFNKQFVFIQELFQNDAIAYMKTIERINEMTKLEEAIAYLSSDVIHKYKWKPESQSVKLFEKIVHQKFGV